MWLFACSFWKVVARCDDAVICPIKKKQIFHMLPRLRSSSLLPAVYCRSPDWSLAAAVHTPADFLSPAELPCSSAALAALNRIFFWGGALRSVLALTHPWPAIFPESLNIRQLLLAPALPTLLLQMSLAATPVRDESQLGPVCLVGE